MESQIKWKRGDYIKLSKAVSRFNKILGDLDTQADYLPEAPEYRTLRDHIHTRKELNRVIASLQSATPENLKSTVMMESGVEISKYEYRQLRLARNRALRNLAKEKRTILEDRPSIGMGDERLSEIRAIELSFEKLETSAGATFDRLAERIMQLGKMDYKMSKDIQFKENFYKALEGISNFQNYDVLKKELDKIKNPSKFYEYVKQSPVLMDLFLWYKESDSLFYGGFSDNQEAFDSTLMFHLGIEDINV